MMLTDAPPGKSNRAGLLESDRIRTLDLTFPTDVTGGQPRTVFCKGRVVRVEPPSHDSGEVGIAVEFESFDDFSEP